MMEPSKEYVRKCLKLADEFLKDARLCLTHLRLRSAINNAYYAMFTPHTQSWLQKELALLKHTKV